MRATLCWVGTLLLLGAGLGAGAVEDGEGAIEGLPGPEDVVLDGARLLVSSEDRRQPGPDSGAIFGVDLATHEVEELPRIGDPEGLSFHPHGIDLVTGDDGVKRLYVISHRREGEGADHAVVVYEVLPNGLSFLELLEDPHLTSPNDLAALPDGGIYVTNDRADADSWNEAVFALKKATVAYCDADRQWSVGAARLAMPNGIAIDGEHVIVALTRENAVIRFRRGDDGALVEREHLATLKGPDNLTVDGREVLVATHEKMAKFMAHYRNPARRSPTRVYRISLDDGVVRRVYDDDGGTISAASVAVPHAGALYLGQVFEPFVLKVSEGE